MNDEEHIIENLKKLIMNSEEYILYKNSVDDLNNNDHINDIIKNIKLKQKTIVNKENKGLNKDKEEFELLNLFRKLKSYIEYNNYIKSSRNLNVLLTNIKSNFEDYFNKLIIWLS